MLRYKTETRPGLVALYDILARKRSVSILTTPQPARGASGISCSYYYYYYYTRIHYHLFNRDYAVGQKPSRDLATGVPTTKPPAREMTLEKS